MQIRIKKLVLIGIISMLMNTPMMEIVVRFAIQYMVQMILKNILLDLCLRTMNVYVCMRMMKDTDPFTHWDALC